MTHSVFFNTHMILPPIELIILRRAQIFKKFQSHNIYITSYNFDTTLIDTIEIVLTYLSLLPIIDIINIAQFQMLQRNPNNQLYDSLSKTGHSGNTSKCR